MRAPQGLCIHPQEDSALRAHSPHGIKIGFIRRIKQNQRKAAFFGRKQRKQRKRISEKHLASAAEAKSLYVALITCIDFLSLSQKTQALPRRESASSPRLPHAGKKIQYLCVFNIELNHAEHGFLHPVESRARVSALRCTNRLPRANLQ